MTIIINLISMKSQINKIQFKLKKQILVKRSVQILIMLLQLIIDPCRNLLTTIWMTKKNKTTKDFGLMIQEVQKRRTQILIYSMNQTHNLQRDQKLKNRFNQSEKRILIFAKKQKNYYLWSKKSNPTLKEKKKRSQM